MMLRSLMLSALLTIAGTAAVAAQPNGLLFVSDPVYGVNQIVELSVLVAHNEAINALSASVSFDPAFLAFEGTSDVDSVVRMWVQRPVAADGVIVFDGVIPGGLQPVFTDTARVVTLRFRALQEGKTVLRAAAPVLYAHQPQTRLLDTVPTELTVSIGQIAEQREPKTDVLVSSEVYVQDIGAEGTFVIYDIRTTDGSVGSVRLRERLLGLPFGTWHDALSPARLSNLWRLSIIEIEVPSTEPAARVTRIPWTLWAAWALVVLVIGGSVYRFIFR